MNGILFEAALHQFATSPDDLTLTATKRRGENGKVSLSINVGPPPKK